MIEKARQAWVPVVLFKVDPDPPPPTCEEGAVEDAEANPGLAAECEAQLKLLDTLDSGGKLNWSATTDISEWEGVTIAGEDDEQRITKLALSDKGLTGELPERLVDLEELTELRVDGNSLTGRIPSVLGNLRHLTHVYVSGNSFTGCYPPSWDDVANNDLSKLTIPSCAISYDWHTTDSVGAPGSYTFLLDSSDLKSQWAPEFKGLPSALLLHESDANGDSQSILYDGIQMADQVEWSRGPDCYINFTITELLPAPSGEPVRRLFAISYHHFSMDNCEGSRLHVYNQTHAVQFIWYPAHWRWGSDEIRLIGAEPVTGPGRYRLHRSSNIVVRIPAGMTVRVEWGEIGGGGVWDVIIDTATGATLLLDSQTGEQTKRSWMSGLSAPEQAKVNAQFDEIEASVEIVGRD